MNPLEHLNFRAGRNADDLAIVSQGRMVTFAELAALVRGAAARLRHQGVRPGQTVAIYLNDPIASWILTLALFHEAAVSVTAHPNFDAMPDGVNADVYVTERIAPFMTSSPTVVLEPGWLKDVAEAGRGITPHAYGAVTDIGKIICSSGTTGRPNAIPLSLALMESRVRHAAIVNPATGPMLCMMALSTLGGFNIAHRALALGLPVFFAYTPPAVIRSIAAGGVSEITVSPAQLAGLVKHLAGRSVQMPSLRTVTSGGASLPAALLIRARATLCTNVVGVYGSTEAGTSARAPTHALERFQGCAGFIEPGVEVELVDDYGQPVGAGQEGVVRIRSESVVSGYLGDPEATATAFRDGWFHPGDLGRFTDNGLLLITGRVTEVINVGGSKMNPVLIDDFLTSQPGVVDAAAFGVEGPGGMIQMWAAVVTQTGFDEERLLDVCRGEFGAKAPARIFSVDEIPRNTMGKIQRADLRESVAAKTTLH